jgi:hypothetical protein
MMKIQVITEGMESRSDALKIRNECSGADENWLNAGFNKIPQTGRKFIESVLLIVRQFPLF